MTLVVPRGAAGQGMPLGPEFRVNTYTTLLPLYPSVVADASGDFVVVWHTFRDSDVDVNGQRYASSGTPLGSEFRVNTMTTSDQERASVSADPSGNFIVAWTSLFQDGSAQGVFAQRYEEIVPVELIRFGVE